MYSLHYKVCPVFITRCVQYSLQGVYSIHYKVCTVLNTSCVQFDLHILRNWFFAINSDFLIPISLQPYVVMIEVLENLNFCQKLIFFISNQVFCLVKKEENLKDIQWMPVQHLFVPCMDLRSQQWKVWGQLKLPCILFRLNSLIFHFKQCFWQFLCAFSFFSHLDQLLMGFGS